MTTTPAWLWRHLEQTGVLGPDRLGRAARATACPHCHQPTLTGLDNDLCAGTARVDPHPVGAVGETLAQLTGRATYTLHRTAGRYELQIRDPWQIAGQPAGIGRNDVLAEHRCNSPLPAIPSVIPQTGKKATNGEPPY